MNRRFVLACAALTMLACQGGPAKDWALPESLEGGWKLSVLPPSRDTFGLVKALAPRKSVMGGYEGAAGKVLVSAFQLANGAAAFEEVQKWHAQRGKIVFHRSAWFVVVESESMDAAALSKIAAGVEKSMPE